MFIQILFILIGFTLLIKGADFLVDGSNAIAKKLHISEIVIGLTIVSIGTSMPELFVSITSALDGYSDMAIGNIIGSNLCNLLLILGLSATIKSVVFQKETRLYEIPMCLLVTIVLMYFCNSQGGISRLEAVILLVLFCAFIGYTIYMGRKESKKEIVEIQTEEKKNSILKNVVFVLLGIFSLKFGGDLVVDNAVNVARYFNWSEKLISLTILAVGTSLPELVTSVTAAVKGNSDIAIGNIIGSNIFNILLIIGVSAFITPITYNFSYNFDFSVLIASSIILAIFPFIPPKDKMSRFNGIVYLFIYVAYLTILFVK